MKTTKYTNARKVLRTLLDEVIDGEPQIIESKTGDVVLMSKSEYETLISQCKSMLEGE